VEAGGTSSGQSKRLIDALVLALGSSALTRTINTGTLRYFIEFTFRDMFNGTAFDLTPLWNVLTVEPGLTEDTFTPPFLQVKEWEPRLGVSVILPQPLTALPRAEVEQHLARLAIKPGALEVILHDDAPPARGPEHPPAQPAAPAAPVPVRAAAAARVTAAPMTAARSAASGKVAAAAPPSAAGRVTQSARAPRLSQKYLDGGEPKGPAARDLIAEASAAMESEGGGATARAAGGGRRALKLAVTAVMAAAALGFVGFRLFGTPSASYRTERFAAILKLEQGRRADFAVTARLADPRWDALTAPERQRRLEELLKAMEPEGVRSLIVRDAAGRTRGLASIVGGQRTVRVE
jgi:hypothetical protein